ncbi:MAG: acetate/propionate family kinase [Desulfatiglandaceae bacterium]
MERHILCINSGSSSIKFALFQMVPAEKLLAEGAVERIGIPGGQLWLKDGRGTSLADRHEAFRDHNAAIKAMLTAAMEDQHLPAPDAVGHRLVHGGPKHTGPEMVTPELLTVLRDLVPLAPLHLPSEIRAIDAVTAHYPKLNQVACFDTAFHRTIPEVAQRLPLPRTFWHEGIRRYGFHGLSYEYIVTTLGEAVRGRMIVAHLGNGASMAALKDGRPQDTTMGFSATGGLMMGTRSGDLDPGILLYLMYEKGFDASSLENLLDKHAGLVGVSGISPDMKTLLDQRDKEPHAAEAVELFCYTARKFIGALAAVLGGLDSLVFTGGIGERAGPVRWMICHGLDHLGIRLDPHQNDADAAVISSKDSPCMVRVISTNEDLMIARHTQRLLFPGSEGEKA